MSIGESFSRLLLARLVDDVFTTGGVEDLDAVVDFLTSCGQQDDPRLRATLEYAMHRAWRAVEVALTDELSWDHRQTGFCPHDAQALRQCLARVVAELAHGCGQPGAPVVVKALRRRCLGELRQARDAGALAGCLDSEEWARSNEIFVRFAAEQGRRDTRRRTEGQLLRDLEEHGCVGLMRVLTSGGGLPLLLMAARAFVCQELAHLLYACLQEAPQQIPENSTRVREILHELSRPRFTVWRAPVRRPVPVHWSRLDNAPKSRQFKPRRSSTPRRIRRAAAAPPRHAWPLAAVLTLAAVLFVVLPIWLFLDDTQRHSRDQQQVAVERQRLRAERRRLEEERQRRIDAQRRIVWEDEIRQNELRRRRQEEERLQRIEAEEERQRAEARAIEQRAKERRRHAEERLAHEREQQQRHERARVVLEDGLMHASLRRDKEALAALSEALQLDPSLDRAWSTRGIVRRRMGNFADALTDFHEAVRLDPRDVRSWFHCGELHARRQEHRRAIDAFSAVLRLEPGNVEAYRQRGLCHARNGARAKALVDQNKAIELAPGDPWAYFYRANLYRQGNDLDLAFDDYTTAIDRDRAGARGLAGAYRERGILLLQRDRFDRAIQDLTRALDLDPTDIAAQRSRGLAYLQNGEWNSALLDAEAAIGHDDEDVAAYKLRGRAYLALKEYKRAHKDFTRVLRLQRDAETFYLRARAKVHLGNIPEAIYDCNDATAIDPRLASAFYLRGNLNLRTGSRSNGLEDRRTAHQLDAHFPLP